MVAGILGTIELVGSDGDAEIDYLVTKQHWKGKGVDIDLGEVDLQVDVHARSTTGLVGAKLELSLKPHNFNGIDSASSVVEDISIAAGSNGVIKGSIHVKKPRLVGLLVFQIVLHF